MAITKEINIVVKEQGLDTVQKQVNKLDASLENLSDTQDSLGKSMQNSSNSVLENGGAMGLLNDATGGLAMTVKDAVEASVLFTKSEKAKSIATAISTTVVGTATGAMKAFRIALAATGIGLIVIGLGLLIANFDKVKKAVLAFIPGLAIVGEIFTSLVQTVTDFIGVTSDASRELDKLGEEAEKTLAKNKFALEAYGDTYDQYTKRKIEANNKYAQHVKDINEDETLSEQQKLKRLKTLRETANREIDKADADRQAEKDKKAKEAQEKIDEINKQASDKRKEERQKEIDEQKKIDEEKAKEASELAGRQGEKAREDYENLQKIIQEAKKKNDDALKTENELKVEAENARFESEKQRLLDANLSIQEVEAEHKRILAGLNDEYYASEADKAKEASDKEIAQAQAVADAKRAIQNGTLDTVSAGIGLLKSLGEKNKAVQKALLVAESAVGIAKIVQNAEIGNAVAMASPLNAVDPTYAARARVLNTISAGIGIASNIAATAKGLAALGGGGAGGGGNALGGSTPSAPSFNLVQGTGSNQIATSISKQQPIEAYVVSKNVTTAAELDRNIVKGASL